MEINKGLAEKYTVRATEQPTKPGCWSWMRCEVLMDGQRIGEYVYQYHGRPPFHAFERNGRHFALYSRDYTATRVMALPSCEDLGGEEGHSFGFCPTGYAVPFGTYSVQGGDPDDVQPYNPRHDPERWARRSESGVLEWPRAGDANWPEYHQACAESDAEFGRWMERRPFVDRPFNGEFGFVCGCVWGDDHSWKIEYLDLADVERGVIRREPRMGYIELLGGAAGLAEAIDVSDWSPDQQTVRVACMRRFDLAKPEIVVTA